MCPLYLLRYLRLPLFFSLLWPLLVSGKDAPPLQLANIYHSSIQIQDYWISEKYDGVRAYWDGKQFISKQGKPYHAPYWFIKNFPDVPLDGELWLARAQFDKLSGIVRKHVPIDAEWQTVIYQVFDLPKSDYTFDVRLEQLEALVKQQTIPAWLQLIPQFKLKNEAELWQTLERINAKKGEVSVLLVEKDDAYVDVTDNLTFLEDDGQSTILRKSKLWGIVPCTVFYSFYSRSSLLANPHRSPRFQH